MNPPVRAFFAIQLPELIKDNIKTNILELKQKFQNSNLKWVDSNNLHITLKFLGELDFHLVEEFANLADKRIKRTKPFELVVKGMGVFPQTKKARVIWIGCENIGPVMEISKMLEEIGTSLGLSSESREFSAHITIARIKFPLEPQALLKLENHINVNRNRLFGSWKVGEFSLYKSDLKPNGPIYSSLRNFNLLP